MGFVTIEDRVDRLEAALGQFMTEMTVLNKHADERSRAADERMARFEQEMRKADGRMGRFEQEMRQADARTAQLGQEMREFKREMNKKWGDLANKMGTIIEDILAPNVRRLATEHFGFDVILDFMLRRRCRQAGQPHGPEAEFDTLVVGAASVILGEAKSTPSRDYADEFAAKVRVFFDFFPEYHGRRLIPVFGSWSIPDDLVAHLTALGIYAMRMGEDTMELANAAELESDCDPAKSGG